MTEVVNPCVPFCRGCQRLGDVIPVFKDPENTATGQYGGPRTPTSDQPLIIGIVW